MASAGQLAKEERPKIYGMDVLQLPLEVAGGIAQAARPSTYLDVGTGYVRDVMRSYRDIPLDPDLVKRLTPLLKKCLFLGSMRKMFW